jgi:hypothetical protein
MLARFTRRSSATTCEIEGNLDVFTFRIVMSWPLSAKGEDLELMEQKRAS